MDKQDLLNLTAEEAKKAYSKVIDEKNKKVLDDLINYLTIKSKEAFLDGCGFHTVLVPGDFIEGKKQLKDDLLSKIFSSWKRYKQINFIKSEKLHNELCALQSQGYRIYVGRHVPTSNEWRERFVPLNVFLKQNYQSDIRIWKFYIYF
jgi:hypothetical protein